jgi:hypothetical protein
MKKQLPWHHTRAGSIVLWLGSIQLAVPILGATAVALAVGTYLDSTKGFKVAKEAVYGSWWFLAVMGLVCVSLIFAVITRYPWKRRHVGFITVHAGLLGVIAGGFVSLFGRLEGHLPLEEGKSSSIMETQDDQVELVEHQGGQFTTVASARGPDGPTVLNLAGNRIQVVERWANSREEQVVNDDAPEPFRGVLVAAQQGAEPRWVGEEGKAGAAPVLADLLVRVLPDGVAWEPPAKETEGAPAKADFAFTFEGKKFPLGEEGQEAFPGWKIASIKKFARAFVGGEGIIESAGGAENPAVDVHITDGKGTTERHTSFLNFPDMVMSRVVEGSAVSGAKLSPAAEPKVETLVIYGPVTATQVGYISPGGEARVIDFNGTFPANLDLGLRKVTLVRQFARARGGWKTIRAEAAKDNRPALVLRIGDATELTVVPFKGTVPIVAGGRNMMFRYVPRTFQVPFEVKLVDFRKMDYPGTEMAMAYESDVEVTLPGKSPTSFRIFMNNPYQHGPWRVYQSGFVGETVSIFSVMRDPGLTLTYIACTVLCIGIVITFFSRSLSWGHPGIPVGFGQKEWSNEAPVAAHIPADPVVVTAPIGTSIPAATGA